MNKKIVALVVAGLALFVVGYGTGRYAAPDKVVVTEKVREVKTEKTTESVDTAKILNILQAMNTQKDVKVVRVVEKAKDGSVKVTTTTEDKSKIEAKTEAQEKSKTVEVRTVEKLVYRDRETTKTIERNRPSWSLAIQPGFAFGTALGLGDQPYNLIPIRHVVANVSIERRLIGPLSVGAWANTHLDGGLSLRLEF